MMDINGEISKISRKVYMEQAAAYLYVRLFGTRKSLSIDPGILQYSPPNYHGSDLVLGWCYNARP